MGIDGYPKEMEFKWIGILWNGNFMELELDGMGNFKAMEFYGMGIL